MEYERIRLLKESEKSTVELVREKEGGRVCIRKLLRGRVCAYQKLRELNHPYLPELYEVEISEDVTTVMEEYIEGRALGEAEMSGKQTVAALRELCSVLDYLHRNGIIHRDIKPSNVLLAKDGHIRLIDFDAARVVKEELEQDTVLLGTRGYAAPEQYGFAQTDERTDIYALGMTMKQLLEEKGERPIYRHMIQKCTNLDPDKRYRSAGQVRAALSWGKYVLPTTAAAAVLLVCVCMGAAVFGRTESTVQTGTGPVQQDEPGAGQQPESGAVQQPESEAVQGTEGEEGSLAVLEPPRTAYWSGETGFGIWGNVPESGTDGEVGYKWKLYRMDTASEPEPQRDELVMEGGIRGNGGIIGEDNTYYNNFAGFLEKNGFYYFEVCAEGDGIRYENSPFVRSDLFEYTGENAPMLPVPEGLAWKMFETENDRSYYAIWSNMEDYADEDSFNVTLYDKDGNYVMNNIWTKQYILERGEGGIMINREFLTDLEGKYRFTVQALTSRPNEYQSSPMPDPIPEEYFSPWFHRYN